ncbi:FtsW/RodA/SpoVE family cell cycle protein [Oceanihabitans sediminis]|uniref:Probable peptidoglycan glycosyltransferase FtsW n=1 Tax=Oceanihabitans sediminis TaxID=1812012 RepID=A0A368P8C1_9FLAO|nr:FtsW/RodA/SpoVE family cell cycle protein [Oceanihabitans sediminis]MDX1277634.1 FtsW/RodA/SpoVE family cell cycle protein [Oceanihabitans sediminis]RBP32062.1 cell division protein FtsW [Oceanihabitans sediminis]RCU58716.1 cell division protein FtsW [Oceanihabitans sediminis]
MQKLFDNIKGDRLIWAIVALLAIFSFLPVYSAASNLAYVKGSSGTFGLLTKHFIHLLLGFGVLFTVHKVPYRYFRGLSAVLIPVVIILLFLTLFQGSASSSGTNTSRWIRIPVVGFTFQPSTFAGVVIMAYVAKYLARVKGELVSFQSSLLYLWLPVFSVLGLILPANFSTAAIIFSMVCVLVFLGGYPLRYLSVIIGVGILTLVMFILMAKAFPDAMPNRVDTWMSRIESFSDSEVTEADYQIEKAKIAIASGGIQGVGPGKSIQKNFLPQSSSDFIYAIIVEEYGLIGGISLVILYMWLLFRIVIVAQKCDTIFGKLLVLGVGLPIVFQALINMGVAVQLFPVTGQTLPLVSSGGTSIWMTCLALGIILSVSAKREEDKSKEGMEGADNNPLDILAETI